MLLKHYSEIAIEVPHSLYSQDLTTLFQWNRVGATVSPLQLPTTRAANSRLRVRTVVGLCRPQ